MDRPPDFSFLNARELDDLFQELNPFDSKLNLKPVESMKTILAANANFPLDLELAAFMEAATEKGGSPLIIQFSSQALETAGAGLSRRRLSRVERLCLGARLARDVARVYGEASRPPCVALALDHFSMPPFGGVSGPGEDEEITFPRADDDEPSVVRLGNVSRDKARECVKKATEAALSFGVKEPSEEEERAYEEYLSSPALEEALEGFIAVIELMRPAWAMIDTGEIPPVLNFAVTKMFSDFVKEKGLDVMIEAEYGATGQSGHGDEYRRLTGKDLDAFAREVSGFVKYTGARGISYPIGMEHAAPAAEKHEPDVERLEVVQREIIKTCGRYVPFAQHGGTGAKRIARGLVGKNNVNTFFLVEAAQKFMAHAFASRDRIEAGEKSACGSQVYLSLSEAIMEAAVGKLNECGTLGYISERD